MSNRGVEIDVHRTKHLATGVGEELAGQLPLPAAPPRAIRGRAATRPILRQLRHQQLGRHQDDRQEIVEIVRNAARQPTDRLGLRRQLTLLFELLAHEQLVSRAGRAAAGRGPMSSSGSSGSSRQSSAPASNTRTANDGSSRHAGHEDWHRRQHRVQPQPRDTVDRR